MERRTDSELIEILTKDRDEYQPEALIAAKTELERRKLSVGQIETATLDTISPLWDWLFKNYHGIMQADGEGYYDADNQILQTG